MRRPARRCATPSAFRNRYVDGADLVHRCPLLELFDDVPPLGERHPDAERTRLWSGSEICPRPVTRAGRAGTRRTTRRAQPTRGGRPGSVGCGPAGLVPTGGSCRRTPRQPAAPGGSGDPWLCGGWTGRHDGHGRSALHALRATSVGGHYESPGSGHRFRLPGDGHPVTESAEATGRWHSRWQQAKSRRRCHIGRYLITRRTLADCWNRPITPITALTRPACTCHRVHICSPVEPNEVGIGLARGAAF